MDISRHLNLIHNHGYKGEIAICKRQVSMLTRAGSVVLFKRYIPDPNAENQMDEVKYCATRCTIELPYSEEQIQKNKQEGNGITTYGTCVGVHLKDLEIIQI